MIQSFLKHNPYSLYQMLTIFATMLLLQPALAETTEIQKMGDAPSFVDIDGDKDLDVFIRANDGTIKYYENVGNANQPVFKERTGAANPLGHVKLGQSIRFPRNRNTRRIPLDILAINDNIYLGPEQSTAKLSLTVDDPKRVKSATATILRPRSDDLTEEEREVIVELPNLSCTFSGSIENVFNVPGPYQVHYFVTENDTDEISIFSGISTVYKNQADNQAPAAFNLFGPLDSTTTKTAFEFNWESATDPEGDLVAYNLIIAQEPDFKKVVVQIENIFNYDEEFSTKQVIDDTTVLKDGSLGIADLSTYYWKIEAVDDFGAITPSRQVFSFKTENTNAGFNLEDISGDGILGKPSIPEPLVVNVSGGRYLVTLTETSPNIFTVTSTDPTEQTNKYEAFYNPVTKKVSIPNYGGMEQISDPDELLFKKID